MKNILILALFACTSCSAPEGQQAEQNDEANASSEISNDLTRWQEQAANTTIIRDQWGIPHIYGKTDADAVFGVMYAQAEDDFNRVEVNYLNAMGRLAEAEGESAIYKDLRMRLFIEEGEMKRLYASSPEWLQKLMNAYADGLNYYLHTHPETVPMAIKHFEPWMALSFSEGSIGGDIERISINNIENFYGDSGIIKMTEAPRDLDLEPRGSNGMAIAPQKTKNGKALLYINPHTSYYFREEAHMVSEEGLNAYGAITWGQFFIYQGFNEKNGWMHTSSKADVIDEYSETIIEKDGKYFYKHGDEEKPVREEVVSISYKTDEGMSSKDFTVYHTHHGPVIRSQGDKWIAVQLMNIPDTALNQSYTRTKTSSYDEFYEMMRLKSNSSNNTVYADADGNIAYFHGNFHPIRDVSFDWNYPVDGSNPATDWKGLHPVEEAINALNPGSGWLYNANNWPFSLAGPDHSPKKEDYPSYMSVNFENPRGDHALGLYPNINDFDIDSLIAAGYDSLLPTFVQLTPKLVAAHGNAPADVKAALQEAVDMLNAWDKRSGLSSIETSLAVHWGTELWRLRPQRRDPYSTYDFLAHEVTDTQYLTALSDAMARMDADFGSWKTPWGDIQRFQRNDGAIVQMFDDSKPSTAMGMSSARWGALGSVGSRQYPQTKKWYGTSGNSFIASIEFGDKVKAKALTAGGLNSDPSSPHFNDQQEMYATGTFRDVNFYREDVEKNKEREYHPGE